MAQMIQLAITSFANWEFHSGLRGIDKAMQ